MSADLEIQKAIRTRLAGTPAVIALVPVANILDTHQRPSRRPAIVIGDAQEVDEGDSIARDRTRVFHTLHIWVTEPSTEGAKRIMAAVRAALHAGRPVLAGGYRCADIRVSGHRILRDPNGEDSHGVVVIDALVVRP